VSLRAAVFDFDGVIVDSEPLHYRALRDALLAEEVLITHEEYYGLYLAYDDWQAIRLALEHHGEPASPERIEAVAERKASLFSDLIPEIPVFPGARELVQTLAAAMPLAIASGARRDEIEAILRGLELRDAFRAVVGSEDAVRGKPDPAPYCEAASRLAAAAPGLEPTQCVAFEDSMAGIASALGAGMKVVGVAHSYAREKLRAAHRVVDSLVELDTVGLRGLFPD
jgi:beta-phosphoglucomutase